jgi:hypothetical protein
MTRVKAHLHLPRLRAGVDEVISVSPANGWGTEYFGTVILTNCKFKVSEAGRQRTLLTRRKNVHAWVIGDVSLAKQTQDTPKWITKEAVYNPYNNETFVDKKSGLPVETAHVVYMTGKKVYYV